MHRLIERVGRRSAGVAAGVILTGGLVGGVLLAPAAAYAGTAAISITSASPSFGGVTVSVSVTGGTQPLGTFSVSGAGNGCTGNLSGGGGMFGGPGAGNGSGTGSCVIHGVAPGTYALTASYDGATGAGSVTVPNPGPTQNPTQGPTQGNGPQFTADSPPSSVTGSSFSYQFSASNSPSYQLVGAPGWLSINNGMVSGNIPNGTTSFSFSVYAWNQWGHVQVGPFWIYFHQHQNFNHHRNFNHFAETNLSTSLHCTSPVYNGGSGSCTLWVSNSNQNFFWGQFNNNNFNFGPNNGPNFGQNFASDITAQISLPYQLRAEYCGYSFFSSCHIYGNTAYENIGNLYPGQTRSLTVHFRVESGFNFWGYNHHGNSFFVRVTGSASSNGGIFNFFGRGQSYSTTYVQIRPYGIWW